MDPPIKMFNAPNWYENENMFPNFMNDTSEK